jgi:competence protein ComEC
MQAMPVGWVCLPLATHALLQSANHTRRCRDGALELTVRLKYTPAGNDSAKKPHDNDQSCVLRTAPASTHLIAADIEKESETTAREHADKLPVALLVVPHHGSKTSSTDGFISAVSPNYAVFTVGYRNHFGHPKHEVVRRYAGSGAQLLRSDSDGAILVEMNAQGLQGRVTANHCRYWTLAAPLGRLMKQLAVFRLVFLTGMPPALLKFRTTPAPACGEISIF